jgi:hypothetical protein
MDDSGTTGEDGRWLTYAELAELRGITRKAAIRLTQRHQWRRQPGNDGATRVFVPADIARRQTPRDGGTPDDGDGTKNTPFHAKALAALEGAVAALREQLERAEAGREAERSRADVLRERVADLQRELDTVRSAAQEAQELAALRQAKEGRAKGEGPSAPRLGRLARAVAADDLRRGLGRAVWQPGAVLRGRWTRLRAAWREQSE